MKQSNKKYKGHSKKQNFNKVKSNAPKSKVKKQNKQERKRMLLEKRKKNTVERKALQQNLGAFHSSPLLVAIVPLSKRASPALLSSLLVQCDPKNEVISRSDWHIRMKVHTFKKQIDLMSCPGWSQLHNTLDLCKLADWILFVCPSDSSELVPSAANMVTTIMTQGVNASLFTLLSQADTCNLKRHIQGLFPVPDDKIWPLNDMADGVKLLRRLCLTVGTQSTGALGLKKAQENGFRVRPGLLVEKLELTDNNEGLRLHGFVRNQALDVRRRVHLLGWGDYFIGQVTQAANERSIQLANVQQINAALEQQDLELLRGYRFDPNHHMSQLDDDEEDDDDDDVDMEDEEDDSSENDTDEESADSDSRPDKSSNGTFPHEEEEDEDDVSMMSGDHDDDETSDYDDAEMEDSTDPCDIFVNAPTDKPARECFHNYFGIASIKKTEISLTDNLPDFYEQLVKFPNYVHTRHRLRHCLQKMRSVENIDQSCCILPGSYVTIDLIGCPTKAILSKHADLTGCPLLLLGLLPCENVTSVCHLALMPTQSYSESTLPIHSKDPIYIQMGFRRFLTPAVFSRQIKHTDRYLFSRHLPFTSAGFATFCAPVMLLNTPVLVWRAPGNASEDANENMNDCDRLVATGTVATLNPDVLILKRILLRAYPFKVQNTSIRLRGMFHNAEDVEYFKEIALFSKFKDEAKILESVGTHGHMKCRLRKSLKHQCPFFMALYKRQFPFAPVVGPLAMPLT